MTEIPAGWDNYDPGDHERTTDPAYQAARAEAKATAQQRRAAYGEALAALRRARSLTQVALARQIGVPQGEVSRIEHQADLLLSTFARYVNGMGGNLGVIVHFGAGGSIELDLALEDLGEGPEAVALPNPESLSKVAAMLGRLPSKEEQFNVYASAA